MPEELYNIAFAKAKVAFSKLQSAGILSESPVSIRPVEPGFLGRL